MKKRISLSVILLLIGIGYLSISAAAEPENKNCQKQPTVIHSVRVLRETRVIDNATVTLVCSRIDQVAENPTMEDYPDDAIIIGGKGKTLMPGLIDSHTHNFRREMLERQLDFGVTTVIDLGSVSKTFAEDIKSENPGMPATDRADLRTTVLWVTAPGSHGTQFGEIPTLVEAEDAEEFVGALVDRGADHIKIIYDNFKMIDRAVPTLSKETMAAAINASHDQGRVAVVHSRDIDAYRDVVEAGADGIVHLPVDAAPDSILIDNMKEKGVYVGPNLAMLRPEGQRLINDPFIGPRLTEGEIKGLNSFFAKHREGGDQLAYNALRAFHEAGITILAGTDAPNGGTAAGPGIHLELELLTESGLTPLEAIAAATAAPAREFGLADRGRIEAGLLADLVLVDGSPDINIMDTRKIEGIWRAGQQHEVK